MRITELGAAQRQLEGYDNRVLKSTELLLQNWSICEGIHDKMAVSLLRADKVSDGRTSSDKKSVLDLKFGRYETFQSSPSPDTILLTATGLTST
jgi:hypothetical protein